ncbi:VOC family protein [Oceanibium sediminis]|uniref:VOC family protein n=1 Tax=Oceanibium sediminis TaxID=2026339 RepID=UPI000DD4443F|nr:VOC family protein [Oceanibium sediminis]
MRPDPTALTILETSLYAGDLAAAEAFYAGVLGLEVVLRKPGRHVFFRVGRAMLLVFDPTATAEAVDEVPTHGAKGPGHMCFAAAEPEFSAWKRHLEGHGIPIEAEITWPTGARSFYLRDPAGNSVEFAEPHLWGAQP